ncbi:MAG: hypothetical protein CMH98_03745 [Oceanospirillaceae bacterium]|nr:hypothetical protein [Oceanospirillaceae bacterium]
MDFNFPDSFSQAELSRPETYENNPELVRLCNRMLYKQLDLPYGQAKRSLLAGQHPDLVLMAVEGHRQAHRSKLKLLEDLELPDNWVSAIAMNGNHWVISVTPDRFVRDCHLRIESMSGWWEGDTHESRLYQRRNNGHNCWFVPINSEAGVRTSQKLNKQIQLGLSEYQEDQDRLKQLAIDERDSAAIEYDKGRQQGVRDHEDFMRNYEVNTGLVTSEPAYVPVDQRIFFDGAGHPYSERLDAEATEIVADWRDAWNPAYPAALADAQARLQRVLNKNFKASGNRSAEQRRALAVKLAERNIDALMLANQFVNQDHSDPRIVIENKNRFSSYSVQYRSPLDIALGFAGEH